MAVGGVAQRQYKHVMGDLKDNNNNMTKRNSIKSNLLGYLNQVSKVAIKKESVTSHIFLSFLTQVSKISVTNLIPQGASKKGQIDYIYFQPKTNNTFFFELKAYGTLKKEVVSLSRQEHKYLYSPIKDLNIIDKRLDIERYLIISDLLSTYITYRSKKSSNWYSLKYEVNDCYELFRRLRTHLKNSKTVLKLKTSILLDNENNLRKACLELLFKSENLFKNLVIKYSKIIETDLRGKGKVQIRFKKFLKSILLNHKNHLNNRDEVKQIIQILKKSTVYNELNKDFQIKYGIKLPKTKWNQILS